jgi:hypothetical protein
MGTPVRRGAADYYFCPRCGRHQPDEFCFYCIYLAEVHRRPRRQRPLPHRLPLLAAQPLPHPLGGLCLPHGPQKWTRGTPHIPQPEF